MGWRLDAAETLWKQADHDGAWLALEELEPIGRMPEVIDLRLRILTNLGKWDLGGQPRLRRPPGAFRMATIIITAADGRGWQEFLALLARAELPWWRHEN